jgi:hypothetical protein
MSLKTERNSIEEVNKVCKSVLKLTEEDLKAVEDMANEQARYTHPFKMKTAEKQHCLGSYNQQVIRAIKDLHCILKTGADI